LTKFFFAQKSHIQGERGMPLDSDFRSWIIVIMSALEIIEQIKVLPAAERAKIAQFVMTEDDSWVPESFKEGMRAAADGRFIDMETVLKEIPPPHLR
jgi:hypothetical protein